MLGAYCLLVLDVFCGLIMVICRFIVCVLGCCYFVGLFGGSWGLWFMLGLLVLCVVIFCKFYFIRLCWYGLVDVWGLGCLLVIC